MNDRVRKRIGTILLGLALAALLFAVGALPVQGRLTLLNELAFGLAGAFLLAFVILEPARTRTWVTGRPVRYGSNALLMTLALLAILGIANFLADRHPYRMDVTANRTLSLSPQTVDVLRTLQGPVRVIAFSPGSIGGRDRAASLLDQYRYHYRHLYVEFHDPEVEYVRAQEWGVTELYRPTVFILYQDRRETIHAVTEEEVTSALVQLARGEKPGVYFLTGHGEPALDDWDDIGLSKLHERLTQEGFEVAPLNLLITATVPSDARAVVVLGPRQPMKQEEVDRLAAYVDGGGSAMILLDPTPDVQGDQGALKDWLARRWGVAFRNDIVLDVASFAYPMPTVPVASASASHSIGRGMSGGTMYFVEARSVTPISPTEAVIPTYTPLVRTSRDSWGETSREELQRLLDVLPSYTEGQDTPGPLDIAATLEDATTGARLAVFGDIHFCANVAVGDLANGDLFVNTLNWLSHEGALISLRPNQDIARYVTIRSNLVRKALFLVVVILLPQSVLGIGAVVYLARRVRR